MFGFFRKRSTQLVIGATALAGGAYTVAVFSKSPSNNAEYNKAFYKPFQRQLDPPPSREALLDRIKSTPKYDVLVIGGGATGTGVAVDAATRGLNVCLLEKTDFAAETSSKSTKMAHGGVRYLEKAIFKLSKAQLDLVIEALNERANMLRTAPHLCSVLPIMIPVYEWWRIPYYYAGCKLYDWFAGSQNLRASTVFSREMTTALAPMLNDSELKAACVYHDGTFNDSRMNTTLAITAVDHGATVLNYMQVKQLIKSSDNKVLGAVAVDRETGIEYEVKATATVNATGPYADKILEMDEDPNGKPPKTAQFPRMVVPSSGVHVVLPEYYCPRDWGLLDPSTKDGRVMFFLPWQGKVLAGTTDNPLKEAVSNPSPSEEDIQDILNELQNYITFPVQRSDVLSAWSGIRPLVRDPSNVPKGLDPSTSSTQGLVRSHLIYVTGTGLVTISGGKWTTYREMAEETVDRLVKDFDFGKTVKPCQTKQLILVGGEDYTKNYSAKLMHTYHIPLNLAKHLSHNYGTRSPLILELYIQSDINKLPVVLAGNRSFTPSKSDVTKNNELSYAAFDEPFTVAELKYSLLYEFTRTPLDFLARRSRLAFLNAREALRAVDGVTTIMKEEFGWDNATAQRLREEAREYIIKMGLPPNSDESSADNTL
ncbi:glycerol-3-phosphate dehydrogenase Gut2 [Schizosaccharomyces cryophilus OY26]|uniref:Glycerol-3-phosphate dehydrogenase n=1 Tax=Schizosaccharomyces cryophilus (strain OY26 / ATCC MYA-4695 / CBS 11777 / NBRC 106824 / NRRL Y48691) TaxID=653667 RepID=S9VWW8_SCHCR|nr:glycerol-3-phosphate dehydrogenase Gut2 [Schizosaccharomyces cryophilus OY26]EPY50435.1 glycerol-3-phosphate dehydrogenase Gut2 [Schizosaccharomyces cryophilus OY26]